MFRPAPALSPIPIPSPSSRNAWTRQRHCSGPPRKPSALPADRADRAQNMIILIDNYDSFTFNLFHCLGGLGADVVVHRNDKITVSQVAGMDPDALVLSPGPCTPNEAGICLALVAKAGSSVPILGVCLGHQAIGQA